MPVTKSSVFSYNAKLFPDSFIPEGFYFPLFFSLIRAVTDRNSNPFPGVFQRYSDTSFLRKPGTECKGMGKRGRALTFPLLEWPSRATARSANIPKL